MRITAITIGGITINITPAPKISKLLTYDVNMRQEVIFEGERLDTPEIQISGEEGVMYNQQSNRVSGVMQGTTGFKDITLKTISQSSYGEIEQSVTYPNAFKLLGDMPQLGEKLEIIPQMGARGSIAYIRADGNFTIKDARASTFSILPTRCYRQIH